MDNKEQNIELLKKKAAESMRKIRPDLERVSRDLHKHDK